MSHVVLITDIEAAFSVYQRIPEFPDRLGLEEIKTRVGEHYLSLVYEHNKQAVGFKLGYAIGEDEFYSWLGGVEPDHRKLGIAKALMLKQEQWCLENGYRMLRVKSMNRYAAMMCMLLSNSYSIDGVSGSDAEAGMKIHFLKRL